MIKSLTGSELFNLIQTYDTADIWSGTNEYAFINVNTTTQRIKYEKGRTLEHIVVRYVDPDDRVGVCFFLSGTRFDCDIDETALKTKRIAKIKVKTDLCKDAVEFVMRKFLE